MAENCKHPNIREWDCGCSTWATCNSCEFDYICADCNQQLDRSHPAVLAWAAVSVARSEALIGLDAPLIDRETKTALCFLFVIALSMICAGLFFR